MAIEDVVSGNIVTDRKFVNDTIGTDKFKPLNKLIEDVGNVIMSEGGVKVVKKVQRGYYKTNFIGQGGIGYVTINKVDPNKSVLILTSGYSTDVGKNGTGQLESTGDRIKLHPNWSRQDTGEIGQPVTFYFDYDWQVVEYY